MTTFIDSLPASSPISRIRRNHGLEHATIHLLSRQHPRTSMAGHSDAGGFWILGDLETEAVERAVETALARLQTGEAGLAIHPNCGTNFATSGMVAGLAAALAMFGAGERTSEKLERLPLAVLFATLGLIVARPLGFYIQANITTSGHPDALEVVQINPTRRGKITAHRVVTRG